MMPAPYPFIRYPEDVEAERREKAVKTLIRSLIALGLFFAGVWVGLVVTP